jgi:hypothetical protein
VRHHACHLLGDIRAGYHTTVQSCFDQIEHSTLICLQSRGTIWIHCTEQRWTTHHVISLQRYRSASRTASSRVASPQRPFSTQVLFQMYFPNRCSDHRPDIGERLYRAWKSSLAHMCCRTAIVCSFSAKVPRCAIYAVGYSSGALLTKYTAPETDAGTVPNRALRGNDVRAATLRATPARARLTAADAQRRTGSRLEPPQRRTAAAMLNTQGAFGTALTSHLTQSSRRL